MGSLVLFLLAACFGTAGAILIRLGIDLMLMSPEERLEHRWDVERRKRFAVFSRARPTQHQEKK